MEVIHLNVHSGYSLLESAVHLEKLVHKAKEYNMPAVALTDKNVMYGSLTFYQLCKKHDVKPIIGLELSVKTEENNVYPLILLAKNKVGYQELVKLSSISQTTEAEYVKKADFHANSDNLVVIMPKNGECGHYINQNDLTKVGNVLEAYKKKYKDDFYLAVEPTNSHFNEHIRQCANSLHIPLVAMNPIFFLDKEDRIAYQCLLAIKFGKSLESDEVLTETYEDGDFKTGDEMRRLFQSFPEAVANTINIMNKCQVDLELGDRMLPKYEVPQQFTAEKYLRKLCEKGLVKRFGKIDDEASRRLDYELSIIQDMEFSDYFLIVWDFMRFAHQKGILTGPGRGSAAGSLVAYVLGITNVDPLKYDLLFERFLNPERISMPDIDIDFPDNRRDEVIQYVEQKYGREHTAQIITFGTLAARAAVRDCGRVLGIRNIDVDRVAKKIPIKPGMTLKKAYSQSEQLRNLIDRAEEYKRLYHIAEKIEGLPRHTSTHAAGIIISDKKLTDIVPVQGEHEDMLLTQYPMDDLESAGLLKMDFLGLRNLSLIESIRRLIRKKTGRDILVKDLPFDDAKTFALLGDGATTGIFQLESEGMRSVLKRLKPNDFEDIVAVNALYRPGPMEQIPDFIERKHGLKSVNYPHPILKPILEKTYGVIVYQEQIMQIASKMAQFSLGEADLLRRAVSKKKADVLQAQREHFVQGCLHNGYDEQVANEIYDLIVQFANYGFNRSHAVAYSMISYQLAYLKANYSLCFMAGLLSSVTGNEEKTAAYIAEAKADGLIVLQPSINHSFASFTVEGDSIRCSLPIIKNIGMKAVREILHQRQNGPFKDLFDFCSRVSLKVVNRKVLEALILSGSFDEFLQERSVLLASLDAAFDYIELAGEMDSGLFLGEEVVPKPNYNEAEPFELKDKLRMEKEVLGFYLSAHPVDEYETLMKSFHTSRIFDLKDKQVKSVVKMVVYLLETKIIETKKGEQMAFAKLNDASGEIDSVIFPDVYQQHRLFLKDDNIYLVEGIIEHRNGKVQINTKKIVPVSRLEGILHQKLYLKINEQNENPKLLNRMKRILQKHSGPVEVFLYYEKEKKTTKLPTAYSIFPSTDCINMLENLLGEKNLALVKR
ncbi:DNA polymerase III subunit alpha [Bacillus solimangrovi]|uniref:DNA polymerase III subunit alpha n=1 Tax=Bacillus solimangrovi TaxID=1305675 RepID=A0A1E5LCP0_9BACI|nr:DNA polymerase III subunit alpha [Bacillus solimangrovi]OEH91851.1 DNA polymerase III subunit alpha [Bacillus solimangrovi]